MWGILLGIILVVTYTFILFVYCNKSYNNGFKDGFRNGREKGYEECVERLNTAFAEDENLDHAKIVLNAKEEV